MSSKNPKVDSLIIHAKQWKDEMQALREIILELGLTEELKWRLPCYTHDGENVAIIQPFKTYFAVMFFKGTLLKDSKKVLSIPGSSQAVRQLRFTSLKEVLKLKPVIKSYLKEAIKISESGEKVQFKETKDISMPVEFQKRLAKNKLLKKAFESLTPGRQRQYLYYFSSAKQSATRESRIEKYTKQILSGHGLKD